MVDGRDIALVALGAAVATALAAMTKGTAPAPAAAASSRAVRVPPTGWLLVVTLKFTDEESAATFLHDFKACADGVTKLEPGTLGYAVSKSDKKPLEYVIFERDS
eukprot:gene8344-18542_t